MTEYEHYIRIKNGLVIHAFSSAFEEPKKSDILIAETNERHFNPDLYTMEGLPRYKWNGEKMIERSIDEIYTLDYLKQRKINELRSRKRIEMIEKLIDEDSDYQAKIKAIKKAKTKTAVEKIDI